MKVGDIVRVKKLNKRGVIQEVLRVGVFRVVVGSLAMTCSAAELVLEGQKPKKSKQWKSTYTPPPRGGSREFDLHGKRVEEGIRIVEDAINTAILDDLEYIDLVHGKGTGKLQAGIHRYLETVSVVKKFKIHDQNTGVTRVYF